MGHSRHFLFFERLVCHRFPKMASRRLAQSAIKWAEFEQMVPKNQLPGFIALKTKSATFVQRVHAAGPESKPAIDWDYYKRMIYGAPGLVESFEKAYGALDVPYPKDVADIKGHIDKQEAEAEIKTKEYITSVHNAVAKSKFVLEKLDKLPKFEQLTHEMMYDYFPDSCLQSGPWKPTRGVGPTVWPHIKVSQPLPGDARGAKWEHPFPGFNCLFSSLSIVNGVRYAF